MSKFQSTISTVAALASIFGAGAAGWKLAQANSDVPPTVIDQKINELDQKLETLTAPEVSEKTIVENPVEKPAHPVVTHSPQPVILPPVTPPPPITPPPPVPTETTP